MAKWKTRKGRFQLGAVLTVLLLAGLAGLDLAWSQSPVFTEQVDIDQQKLQAGEYPLFKVLESGGQFFSTPYIPFDRETGQQHSHPGYIPVVLAGLVGAAEDYITNIFRIDG